jgi:uroporphyrinogen-III decarboxylase
LDGYFNKLGADVIETIAPPPEGDNDLEESRKMIDSTICSKGNFNLHMLRDGNPDEIKSHVEKMVKAVEGYAHIFSTADAVLDGTPPENYVTFVSEIKNLIERIY